MMAGARSEDSRGLPIWTCRACGVDISVPPDLLDPRCPRCDGALVEPSHPQGEATEKTLLELKPDTGSGRLPGRGPPTRADEDSLSDTASYPPERARADPAPGPRAVPRRARRWIGPYELKGILGKGGMGVVYEAFHPELNRTVALKVMHGTDVGEEELLRFKREARAAAKLQHPNIVPLHEVGEDEGRHFFTMDLVRGETLQSKARQTGITPEESARVLAKVARAIHYAHERDIIHRDIKPSNIIVDRDGEPRVMDFGLAKDMSEASALTLTGVAMGSPPYMPPEQARGEFKQVDAVSDVYGLGAALYECLTGGPPFRGKSLYDVIAKVLVEEPPPPRKKRPEVPYDLETICLKALEKEKWRRYPSALDLALDLEAHLQGRSIRAVRQGLTTRMGRVISRHKLQIFSVLIPLAVVAALAAYTFGAKEPAPPPPLEEAVELVTRQGPIALAEEHVAEGGESGLRLLLEQATQRPSWDAVSELLEPLHDRGDARRTFQRARRDHAGAGSDAVPTQLLVDLAQDLVRDTRDAETRVETDRLAELVTAFLREGDPALAELARRAALGLRGAQERDPEPFRLALLGRGTPLDRALLRCAARSVAAFARADDPYAAALQELVDEPARRAGLPDVGEPPRQLQPHGVIRSAERPGRPSWSFPPVALPGEPRSETDAGGRLLRPPVRGLRTPGSQRALWPTYPLRSRAGRYVLVGWLRTLYLLDDASGRVLQRQRLPGLAERLEYAPDGSFRLSTWARGAERTWALDFDPASERLQLSDPGGGGIAASEGLPATRAEVPDQHWRTACALFPQFEELLELWEARPEGRVLIRQALLQPPAGWCLELGFTQDDFAPCLATGEAVGSEQVAARTVRAVRPGSRAEAAFLRPGDELVELRIPDGVMRTALGVTFLRRKAGEFPLLATSYQPFRPLAPEELADCVRRVEDLLVAGETANPWTLAFGAAALALHSGHVATLSGDGARPVETASLTRARELAERAARSELLLPQRRVVLGCFLDRHGLEGAADLAFEGALSELLREHAYLPEWAGYGPLDCGRPLALRAELCALRERRPERARALAAWRDAFAPVLHESRFARRAYRLVGHPAEGPRTAQPEPPELPELPKPRKGIGGLHALALFRMDHANRLQGGFVVCMLGLLLIAFVRYRRHAIRDLARAGHTTVWARQLLWLRKPWVRLRFSWVTYVSLYDKLCFVILFLVYFGIFALQDAGLDALVVQRNAPEALLAGLPAEPASANWLEERLAEDEPPDPEAAYVVAWVRAARGLAVSPELRAALAARGESRDRLLLGELLLAAGDEAAAEGHLAAAAEAKQLEASVALLRARAAGDREEERLLAPLVARSSLRLGVARRVTPALPAPLAPPPSIAARDRLLLGSDAWWKRVPALLLRNMVQPFPERMDASIVAFQSAYNWNITLARLRNDWFFLLPATLVLLVASLFVPSARTFEPLPEDLEPPRSVRLLALLFPGVPQFMRGRPVRGVLLLLPAFYVLQTLYHAGTGRSIFGKLYDLVSRLNALELASITAENASAMEAVGAHHSLELAGFLLGVYALHWADLALASRKVFRKGSARDASHLIIPIDTASDARRASERAARASARGSGPVAGKPGPFDATERDMQVPSAGSAPRRGSAPGSRRVGPFDVTERQAVPFDDSRPLRDSEDDEPLAARPTPDAFGSPSFEATEREVVPFDDSLPLLDSGDDEPVERTERELRPRAPRAPRAPRVQPRREASGSRSFEATEREVVPFDDSLPLLDSREDEAPPRPPEEAFGSPSFEATERDLSLDDFRGSSGFEATESGRPDL